MLPYQCQPPIPTGLPTSQCLLVHHPFTDISLSFASKIMFLGFLKATPGPVGLSYAGLPLASLSSPTSCSMAILLAPWAFLETISFDTLCGSQYSNPLFVGLRGPRNPNNLTHCVHSLNCMVQYTVVSLCEAWREKKCIIKMNFVPRMSQHCSKFFRDTKTSKTKSYASFSQALPEQGQKCWLSWSILGHPERILEHSGMS